MSSAIYLPRGKNPRRKWEYERNDRFNRSMIFTFKVTLTEFILVGVFNLIVGYLR